MKKRGQRGKKAQLEISFGMVFSILIIIAILGVAFYAISYFLKISKCAQTGIFYKDIEDEVEKAWASEITQKTISGTIPSGIDKVCFGSLSLDYTGFTAEHDSIGRLFRNSESNVFAYPTAKACSKDAASYNLKHAEANSFFCAESKDGKVEIKLSKESTDALVTISPAG